MNDKIVAKQERTNRIEQDYNHMKQYGSNTFNILDIQTNFTQKSRKNKYKK